MIRIEQKKDGYYLYKDNKNGDVYLGKFSTLELAEKSKEMLECVSIYKPAKIKGDS